MTGERCLSHNAVCNPSKGGLQRTGHSCCSEVADTMIDRQTGRQADRRTDGPVDGQTDTLTDRPTAGPWSYSLMYMTNDKCL